MNYDTPTDTVNGSKPLHYNDDLFKGLVDEKSDSIADMSAFITNNVYLFMLCGSRQLGLGHDAPIDSLY